MPNRLATSTSPYLRQHADNPVDWHEWGDEAFHLARREDRPILLSVGYSACHWCHVMAHESFEDPAIARLMNERFVNVKVDREERPDVDAVYMEAVQRMTGQGGWPMTVFLTPEGQPFFGGTYFPPVSRRGLIGFPQLLQAVWSAWRERREEVVTEAERLTEAMRAAVALDAPESALSATTVDRAVTRLLARHDDDLGGFGQAPKFPPHGVLRFLLGRDARSDRPDVRGAVRRTLDAMASGGIRDHLGGGFHRYSVDGGWTVPHFEKMLYDNAQLARAYLCAWQRFGESTYREVAVETLDYVLRELHDEGGAFHAAQDADTAGGEGAFFTWTPEEVRGALPPAEAAAALAWFGVQPTGNFEGATVLTARRSQAEVAAELGTSAEELEARLRSARAGLLRARARREAPVTDTKILVDWNALAIDAFARAGRALGRDDYVAAARGAARHILDLADRDGGLAHSWSDDRRGAPAFLEDHAALAGALLTLYETDFAPEWVARAREAADRMISHHAAPGGGFFRTGGGRDELIVRQRDVFDGSVPSGNALAADALLRLAALTSERAYEDAALGALRAGAAVMAQLPSAAGEMLAALDDHVSGFREIAILGPDPEAMLQVVRARCLPGTVVAAAASPDGALEVPLIRDRPVPDEGSVAYVCRGGVCDAPTRSAEALDRQLRRHPSTPESGGDRQEEDGS